MKLDLIEIDKLSPRGLYVLAELRAVVAVLVSVIKAGIGSAREVRSYAFMLVQYRKTLRERAQHNQNLKIKTWVMQCPKRTTWVRSVIGEATIRRWIIRMRAAYFSPTMMGNGLPEDGRDKKPEIKYGPRTIKPFALAKLSQVEKLLPFRPRWPRNTGRAVSQDTGNLRRGLPLTGCGHSDKTQPSRPPCQKDPRPQEPVRFFPCELGVNILEPESKDKIQNQKYVEAPPAQFAEKLSPEKLNGPHTRCLLDARPLEHPP
ncbi:MAG: hypothetical protein COA91_01910 [Robiginitomaculum sp.]|nr:MAG: hypothetical protein COA91_01910 [Robiginitomaculum sp.]